MIAVTVDTPLPDLTPDDVADLTLTELGEKRRLYRREQESLAIVAADLLYANTASQWVGILNTAREYAAEAVRIRTSVHVIADEQRGRRVAEDIIASGVLS